MNKEQYFARKSAPPPPSPDTPPSPPQQQMEDGEIPDDFLMDIGNPFDNPSTLHTPTINRAETTTAEGARNDDEGSNKEGSPEVAQPNVDELLASLEATVNNNNSSISGDKCAPLPQDPVGTPLNSNPPLQQTNSEQPNNRQGETHPHPSLDSSTTEDNTQGKENSVPSGRKRKPRKPRQQKNQQNQQKTSRAKKNSGNTGSQRTMGRDATSTLSSDSIPVTPPTPLHRSANSLPADAKNKKNVTSRNRVWLASGPSSAPSSDVASSSSTPSTGGRKGPAPSPLPAAMASPSSAPPPSPATSGYNRVPRAASEICQDVTSFKFIPEDPSQIQTVLDIIHGDRKATPSPAKNGNMIEVHNFPTVFSAEVTGVPLDSAPGANAAWDEEHFITITDFPDAYPPERASLHSIQRRPSITFLLLCRQTGTRTRWEIPTIELAADFVNDALCSMYNVDVPFSDAYDRSGRWGAIPTLLLKSSSVPELEEFRRQLNKWSYKGQCWETFPRDVITMKADLSILLRNKMKSFQLEVLPKILFSRNRSRIAGSLRVLSHRNFPDGETSNKGESKENWRQVDLKGDDQLLRCLRFIPESSPFLLGVETVQIRGGLRPQDSLSSDDDGRRVTKRPWSEPAPPPTPTILSPSSSSSLGGPTPPRGGFPKRGRAAGRGSRRGNRGSRS